MQQENIKVITLVALPSINSNVQSVIINCPLRLHPHIMQLATFFYIIHPRHKHTNIHIHM